MNHLKKQIIEQIAILSDHGCLGTDICFHFVRNHALSIVQMSEEALAPARHLIEPGHTPEADLSA